MVRITALVLALFAQSASDSRWIPFDAVNNDGSPSYLDQNSFPSTTTRPFTIWMKTVPSDRAKSSFSAVLDHLRVDCQKQEIAELEELSYYRNSTRYEDSPINEPMSSPVPDSVGESVVRAFCGNPPMFLTTGDVRPVRSHQTRRRKKLN